MSEEEGLEGFPDLKEFFDHPDSKIEVVDELSYDTILRTTEERINQEGWDRRPILAFIRGNTLGAETAELLLPEEVSHDFQTAFPIFAEEIMTAIGQHRDGGPTGAFMKMLQEEFLGPSFAGLLISVEGWTVPAPDKDTEPDKWAAWVAAHRAGKFHQREDRQEMRITSLLTPGSDLYSALRIRGGEPKMEFASGEDWEFGQHGILPEAMRTLMRAMIALQALKGFHNDELSNYWGRQYQKAKAAGVVREVLKPREEDQ